MRETWKDLFGSAFCPGVVWAKGVVVPGGSGVVFFQKKNNKVFFNKMLVVFFVGRDVIFCSVQRVK